MKKILNIFLYVVIASFIACKSSSCVTSYGNIHENEIGTQVITSEQYVMNKKEFKEKCKEEKISSKLSKWNRASFKSYENNKSFSQYFYIKEIDYDSIIARKMYRLDLVIDGDTTYTLLIRKTSKIK